MAEVVVSRHGVDSIRRGHPWIYRSNVAQIFERDHGIVRIADEQGQPLGWGVWDAGSPIALRVWSRDAAIALTPALFVQRLEHAIAVRQRLFSDGGTTAYRLVNGEGDRMPGFVIDRYTDVAVLRIDGDAARAIAPELTEGIEPVLRAMGITCLLHRTGKKGATPDVNAWFGVKRDTVEVHEHGVPFLVDLVRGQKTGAFLDQRENRRRVEEIVRRRVAPAVLNLFSYTGGFSQRAARAGGIVTSVDVAAAAHATAQRSFRLSGIDPKPHSFVTADCFAFLERAKKQGLRWDVVISDPPSFAPSEKAKAKGIAAYRALHRACVDVLAERGTLVAASCSSHVTLEDFASTLDDAALGRSDLSLLGLYGPPEDHPTLPAFPEGRYLKLAMLE